MRNYKIENEMYRMAVELIKKDILQAGAVQVLSILQKETITQASSLIVPTDAPRCALKQERCSRRSSSMRKLHTVCVSFGKMKIHHIKCCLRVESVRSG